MKDSNEARILLWDIESTGLYLDFARLLCIGYKWYGEKKVHIPKIELPESGSWDKAEKQLVKDFMEVYEQADILVTYNGKRFDVPAVQAKALHYGLGVLPNTPHVDLYYTAKSNLKISRKSLQNVGFFLGLNQEKTPVNGKLWLEAQSGNKKALKDIVDHCRADVLMLEEAYTVMRPLVRTHPRVDGYGPCRVCGSRKLQRRGPYITKTKNNAQRVQCQECGSWDTRSL